MSQLDLEEAFREAGEFFRRAGVLARRSLGHWRVWGAALPLACLAGLVAPKLLLPVYESQAVLMYRETLQTESLLGRQERREPWAQTSRRFIDSALSRVALEAVIRDFGLYSEIVRRHGMVAAVDELRRKASIDARQGSTLVVTFRGNQPEQARAVANRLTELLKKEPGRDAAGQAEATRKFLEAQLGVLRRDLESKEKELAAFLAHNPEFALEDEGGMRAGAMFRAAERRALPAGRSSRLDTLLRQEQRLSLQIEALRAPASLARTLPSTSPVAPEVAAAERAALEALTRLKSLKTQFTDIHPDVVEASQRVAETRSALAEAEREVAQGGAREAMTTGGSEASSALLAERLKQLQNAILVERRSRSDARGPLGGPLESVVNVEIRWVVLNREAASARDQYEFVEKRLFEAATLAQVVTSGGQGEIVTTDAAYLPLQPIARSPRRVACLALLAGLFGAAALAFAFTLLDARVFDEHELKSLKIGPLVHVLPPLGAPGRS